MELQIGLLFSLAVIAALYGSVGHGGASGYLAVLSLSIFAFNGAVWLKPHALCLNLVVVTIGLYHYGRLGYFNIKLICLLYTSPSPRDLSTSRMPSSA